MRKKKGIWGIFAQAMWAFTLTEGKEPEGKEPEAKSSKLKGHDSYTASETVGHVKSQLQDDVMIPIYRIPFICRSDSNKTV